MSIDDKIDVEVLRCQQHRGCPDVLAIGVTSVSYACGGPYKVLMTFAVERSAITKAIGLARQP